MRSHLRPVLIIWIRVSYKCALTVISWATNEGSRESVLTVIGVCCPSLEAIGSSFCWCIDNRECCVGCQSQKK